MYASSSLLLLSTHLRGLSNFAEDSLSIERERERVVGLLILLEPVSVLSKWLLE